MKTSQTDQSNQRRNSGSERMSAELTIDAIQADLSFLLYFLSSHMKLILKTVKDQIKKQHIHYISAGPGY